MADGYCVKRLVGTACFVSFLGLSSGDAALATIYQWEDEHGTVGFTDDLQRVPQEYRKSAKRLEENSSRIGLAAPAITNRSAIERSATAPSAGPIESDADRYAVWLARLDNARKDLEEIKVKRQKAEEERVDMLRQLWYKWGFLDEEQYFKLLARIRDLDQQIRDKEYALDSIIPDEARRASIPPGVLRSP